MRTILEQNLQTYAFLFILDDLSARSYSSAPALSIIHILIFTAVRNVLERPTSTVIPLDLRRRLRGSSSLLQRQGCPISILLIQITNRHFTLRGGMSCQIWWKENKTEITLRFQTRS